MESAPAASLYNSPLFRKSLLASLNATKHIYVLSAKHGVLKPDNIIPPYDVTLKGMSLADREAWRNRVVTELTTGIVKPGDIVSLYCGHEYAAPLRNHLLKYGCRLEAPLAGLSLGQRLQFLRARNDEAALEAALDKFYQIIRRLWTAQSRGRRIADCSGKLPWPERGVYFIIDDPEASLARMPRIVRVGTHAVSLGARTSLWNRISTHRGATHGGGSHRSSIFRSHVGRALMNREPLQQWPVTWAQGQSAPKPVRDAEIAFEQMVSTVIGDMRLLWLNIPDIAGPQSDRAYIERNAIGLLSRAGLLHPHSRETWLGDMSADWRIAVSGLWNLDYLFQKPDPMFLSVLDAYVSITVGEAPLPQTSLAPDSWRAATKRQIATTQLNLFFEGAEGYV